MTRDKIKTLAQIRPLAAKLKGEGKRIVFTNGCFDILHYGHVKYLDEAHALGDVLIVGVNSDFSTRTIKGQGRPIMGEASRSNVLAGLESVDFVVIFKEAAPLNLIRAVRPNVLVKGGDWKKGDIVGAADVEKKGGKVVSIPFVKGFSTSKIIKKILKNAGKTKKRHVR